MSLGVGGFAGHLQGWGLKRQGRGLRVKTGPLPGVLSWGPGELQGLGSTEVGAQ